MSDRYPGGIISKTAPVPSGPYANSTAPGVWTLDQQSYWQAQGNWPTFGNVNPNAFIENLFQTWLYTGTGSTQTISNGLNFSSNGGMVWTKSRSAVRSNNIVDTVRGGDKMMYTDSTGTEFSLSGLGYAPFTFSTTGFVESDAPVNAQSGATFAAWSFRKQPKFFDIVTYTGNGSSNRQIPHNLGSVPGMMMVKCTSATGNWTVYNIGMGDPQPTPDSEYYYMYLNTTASYNAGANRWANTKPTATNFTVGSSADVNTAGATYVAYLFASNAGGFGLSGSDNVITCGSFSTDGATTTTVNLGYEPQYLMVKLMNGTSDWYLLDIMRGLTFNISGNTLAANTSAAEVNNSAYTVSINATGFTVPPSSNLNNSGQTYIYMAIRRPMMVPTSATTVFQAGYNASSLANQVNGTIGAIDLTLQTQIPTPIGGYNFTALDRLRGKNLFVSTDSTNAEAAGAVAFDTQVGVKNGTWFTAGGVWYNLVRRPGFFDIVTLTNGQNTYNNSLGTAPNMIWVKCTSAAGANWVVYHDGLSNPNNQYLRLNTSGAYSGFTGAWSVSSSTFTVASGLWANGTNGIAYLFATCPGVSKVGSYTGTGATQTINCGFTGGARLVLIKRTDSTGDWWIWDSTQGMVAGNDPRLTLNSVTTQTNSNWVYTATTGFQIVTSDASVNANGGSYVFLAIA